MENEELINAGMLTAKTQGEYSVKPLLLPEEPKRLKLDKAEPLTKVEPGQPSDVPKAPKRINKGFKLDWQKNTMMMNNKPARAAAAQLDSANEQPTPQAGLN